MRVVILGAGGIGSVVAGYLARAGVDVAMIARPAHADQVNAHGLQVTGLESFRVPVRATSDAAELESADVLLVTVKTPQTLEALDDVKHLRVGSVMSFQNGMIKNEQLASVFGGDKVVGAATQIAASLLGPGEVAYTLDGLSLFGELDGRPSERVTAFAEAFAGSGLNGAIADDIESVEWTKQAIQSPLSSLAAITRLPMHSIWSSPELAEICVHMFREVSTVAAARGVAVKSHPAWDLFDIDVWRDAPLPEASRAIIQVGERAAASGRTRIVSSMLADVIAQKRTEIEETVGYVVHEARRLSIDVPYNEFAYRTIKAMHDNYADRVN